LASGKLAKSKTAVNTNIKNKKPIAIKANLLLEKKLIVFLKISLFLLKE
jgi:hypothetical protein